MDICVCLHGVCVHAWKYVLWYVLARVQLPEGPGFVRGLHGIQGLQPQALQELASMSTLPLMQADGKTLSTQAADRSVKEKAVCTACIVPVHCMTSRYDDHARAYASC